MGVPGLWDILRPAGETRSLTHLAVVDGFEANPDGHRGFRVGIDASIWFFHAAYGREGENPELRTLFFKCTRLMSAPFLPLFVFDGPKRPDIKRGKHISGKNHWLIQGMQEIINAFGFEWRIAPGEAEAELAYMNRIGIIDAVMTDDVDTFVFGATMVVRNSSITLSGNKGHSLKNAAGKDDGNHAATYKLRDITRHPGIGLTQGGLILIAILRGGDYHPAGLTGCGPAIAHGLARCGFGDNLIDAARKLSQEHLKGFLVAWRAEVREELRTNARGHLPRKFPALAKALTEDFPNMEVLLSYTDPITSEPKGRAARNVNIDWEKEPDLGKIAGLCEMYFEWGVKEIIIKRFRTVLWPSAVLRILRRAVLVADKRAARLLQMQSEGMPSTPRKKGDQGRPVPPGTPSTMIAKHFSSLQLGSPSRARDVDSDQEEEPEDSLVVKIHSSRQHASTDGILEYRLEIAPAQLVRICDAGVKGLRTALATGLAESDEDDNEDVDGGKGKDKAKKPPPDPLSPLRIWLPACMVRRVHPDLVEEFEGVREKRQAKKAGNGAKTGTVALRGKTKKAVAKAVVADEEGGSAVLAPKAKANQAARKAAAIPAEEEESYDLALKARMKKTATSVAAIPVEEQESEDAASPAKASKPNKTTSNRAVVAAEEEGSDQPGTRYALAPTKTATAAIKDISEKPRAKPNATTSNPSRKLDDIFAARKATAVTKSKLPTKPKATSSTARISALFADLPRTTQDKKHGKVIELSDSSDDDAVLFPIRLSSLTTAASTLTSSLATTRSALSGSELGNVQPAKLLAPKLRVQLRPFLMSFSTDDEVAFQHENVSKKPAQRARRKPPSSSESEDRGAEMHKSPRRSPAHTSPHSFPPRGNSDDEGYGSPTPQRPRAGALSSKPLLVSPVRRARAPTAVDKSVIEILSDSDSPPPKLAPLLTAKAKKSGSRMTSTTSVPLKDSRGVAPVNPAMPKPRIRPRTYDPEDIIDLT